MSKFEHLSMPCTTLHNFDQDCLPFAADTLRAAVIASARAYTGVYLVSTL